MEGNGGAEIVLTWGKAGLPLGGPARRERLPGADGTPCGSLSREATPGYLTRVTWTSPLCGFQSLAGILELRTAQTPGCKGVSSGLRGQWVRPCPQQWGQTAAIHPQCEFPRAAVTNDHKLGGLKTTEICSLTLLELMCSKRRCGQGHVLSAGSGGGAFLLLRLLWVPTVLGWWQQQSSLCLCLHVASSLCVRVSRFKDTSH